MSAPPQYVLLEEGRSRPQQAAGGLSFVSIVAVVLAAVALTLSGVSFHKSSENTISGLTQGATVSKVQTTQAVHAISSASSAMIAAFPLCSSNIANWKACQDLSATLSRLHNNTNATIYETMDGVRSGAFNVGAAHAFLGDMATGKLIATSPALSAFEGQVDGLVDSNNCAHIFESTVCLQYYFDEATGNSALAATWGNFADSTDVEGRGRRFGFGGSWGGFFGAAGSGAVAGGISGAVVGSIGAGAGALPGAGLGALGGGISGAVGYALNNFDWRK